MSFINVMSERDRDIENMTFAGVVVVCRAASIDATNQTLCELKDLLRRQTDISLDPGRSYTKTSQIIPASVKRVIVPPEIGDTRSSDQASKITIDFSEMAISEKNYSRYRVVSTVNDTTTKKKGSWVVLRGDSTFLGAFTSKRTLDSALKTKYPNVDIATFHTDTGHDDVRVIKFSGTSLLNDDLPEKAS